MSAGESTHHGASFAPANLLSHAQLLLQTFPTGQSDQSLNGALKALMEGAKDVAVHG